jgi:hypothetical protein
MKSGNYGKDESSNNTLFLLSTYACLIRCVPVRTMTVNFYVHVYIDPRDYQPFYYGKGRGSRKDAGRASPDSRNNPDLAIPKLTDEFGERTVH